MVTVECPICGRDIDCEALLDERRTRCEECVVVLELAVEPGELAAAA